jgi:hypothetical protein
MLSYNELRFNFYSIINNMMSYYVQSTFLKPIIFTLSSLSIITFCEYQPIF